MSSALIEPGGPTRTVMEVLRLSTGYLSGHGSSSPRLDAEVLAATALGLGRLDLYLQFDRPLEPAQLSAIRELLRRRAAGEPVAHITGVREFYGRTFTVTPEVLIPRPETETLVTLALERARGLKESPVRIADVGTGSGCIAVSLAAELPVSRLVATDISPDALAVARANVARHGVAERVELVAGSWCEPLRGGERFDIVVANPPYVVSADLAALDAGVRDHEPALALDGGPDGISAYRALMPSVAAVIAPSGWVAVEIDPRQAEAVGRLGLEAFGEGTSVVIHEDLGRRARVVSFTTAPP